MEVTSLCDVLIEFVDRYITEKQERLRYCSELKKAKEEIARLSSQQQERDENA